LGERSKKVAGRSRIWPLLVYGGLATIAMAFRKEPGPELESEEIVRKASRPVPAPDETSEFPGSTPPTTQIDGKQIDGKRPQEQVENDQPVSAQISRAKEQGRGRHAVVPWEIPWTG
jgi:hypothetical protein